MRLPFRALHTVLILASLTSTQASAALPIEPESGQSALYREIIERLDARHYRAQSIDDKFSEGYLDQ